MGKHRSSPSGRKNPMRKRGIELFCAVARPPQECWSIRERINFRIALARYMVLLKHEPESLLQAGTTKYVQSFTPYTTNSKHSSFRVIVDLVRTGHELHNSSPQTTDQVRMPPACFMVCLLTVVTSSSMHESLKLHAL